MHSCCHTHTSRKTENGDSDDRSNEPPDCCSFGDSDYCSNKSPDSCSFGGSNKCSNRATNMEPDLHPYRSSHNTTAEPVAEF